MDNTYQLSKVEIQGLFESLFSSGLTNRYKKFQPVDARQADNGEIIITVIGGEIETTNVAKDNGVILMNMTTKSREQYILTLDKFKSRYKHTETINGEWNRYEPIGEVDCIEWINRSAQFLAPWDELMIINKGDFLCRVPGTIDDVYRIARDEFFETYKPV